MTDLIAMHRRAAAQFDERVQAISDDQWSQPTPCEGWDVHELVRHLVEDNLWVPHLMKGAKIEDIGDRFTGDVLGATPKRAWEESIADALAAFDEEDALEQTVHLSFGDVPASTYAEQRTIDLIVHAWDLARAIGSDERLDGTVVAFCLLEVGAQEELIRKSGKFADEVEVAAGADAQTRLLAKLGRRA